MEHTYWHKQTSTKPLFPDLLWDKPESKLHAGKLLIIGGNAHSFTAPATAYNESLTAGVGDVKVLLPDVLKKSVGPVLTNGEFAPSNKGGSFSKQALSEWLSFSDWADGVLLPGDLGRNSETSIVFEKFAQRYKGPLSITHDALDYITSNPEHLLSRNDTTLIASFAQLQKLALNSHFTQAFTYNMPVALMVDLLHLYTSLHNPAIVMLHNGVYFVAKDGDVCTTQHTNEPINWRVATAAAASVWTLQNPSKHYAALCTAVYELTKKSD